MHLKDALEKIGFSPNEIKVYLTLNDKGSHPAGKISKLAKIDRSSCYNTLKKLQEKGLVAYSIQANVKQFHATSPRSILDHIQEQENTIKSVLPELNARHSMSKVEGQIRLFKSIRGVKNVFEDIARAKKNNYVFGSEGQFSERIPEFAMRFDRLKRENNIKTKMIIRKGRKELDNKRTEYRFVPSTCESPAVTNIYGNKVAIIIWTDEPEGIIIENKMVAKAYKTYFDFIWKYSERK